MRLRVDVGQPGLLVVVQHRVRPPAEHRADRLVPGTRSRVRSRRAVAGRSAAGAEHRDQPDDERPDQHRPPQPPAPCAPAPSCATPSPSAPAATLGVVRNGAADQALVTDVRRRLQEAGDADEGGADAGLHEVGAALPRRHQPRLPGDHARRAGRPRAARPGHLAGDRAGALGRRHPSRGAVRRARRRQGPPVRRATATRTSCRCTGTCWSPAPGGTSSTTSPPTWSGRCCWRTPAGSARPWPPGRPTRTGGCAARR